MALTTAQETALLALLEAIPSDELVNINDLSDAGTLVATTNFPAQQSNAGDVAQKMPRSSMIVTSAMDINNASDPVKSVTPAAFFATRAADENPGVIFVAGNADIAGRSSTAALTPNKAEVLFEEMVKNTGDVNDSDIDSSTASFAAVTVGTVLTGTIGKTSHWIGSIGVTPVFSTGFFYIYINNVKQPSFKQPFNGFYIRADNTDDTYVFGGFISAVGDADSNELGQVLLQIRNTDEVNWYTDRVSTLYFNFRYFI